MNSLDEDEWMVSLDTLLFTQITEIEPELKFIKKLSRKDSIYCKFPLRIQRKIQSTIAFRLFFQKFYNSATNSQYLANDLIVNDLSYEYFGVKFDATLIVWKHWSSMGQLRIWNSTPKLVNDGIITFSACTVSSKTNVKIIEDICLLYVKLMK